MKDFNLCGKLLNRGRAIITAVYIPCVVFLLCAETILIAIGQDPETAREA
jgi:multidrug resistance protein, MATE family